MSTTFDLPLRGNAMIGVPRLVITITAMALLSLCLLACEAPVSDEDLTQRAKNFQAEGKLSAALIELKNAAVKAPTNVETRLLLAEIQLETGDPAAAEKEATTARELGAPESLVQPLLVKSLLMQGKADEVLDEAFTLADGLSPADEAMLMSMFGQAYALKNQLDKAGLFLERSLEIAPENVEALVAQGSISLLQGEFGKAREWNDRAIKADESFVPAWSQLGQIELDTDNYAEAEEAFSRAIELSKYPRLDPARRAFVRVVLNNYSGAEADLEMVRSSVYANHPYFYYVDGIVNIKQGKYEEAKQAFAKVLNVQSDHLPSKFYMASAMLALEQYEQANAMAAQIYQALPDNPMAARLLGSVHAGRSDFDAAAEVLESSLRGTAQDAAALGLLGSLALAEGDPEQGVKYFERMAAISPDSPSIDEMLLLARIMNGEAIASDVTDASYDQQFLYAINLFHQGKIGEALKQAESLSDSYPDKVEPLNLVGACYMMASDWTNSRLALEKSLLVSPLNRSATTNLAQIDVFEGEFEQARQRLMHYLQRRPGDSRAILLLASVEDKLEKPDAASDLLRKALDASPEAADIRLALVRRSFAQHDAEAVALLTEDLPEHIVRHEPALLELRGRSQMISGEPAAAAQSFSLWVQIAPENARARTFYGDSLAAEGVTDDALVEYARAIELDIEYLAPRIGAARIYLQRRDTENAAQAIAEINKRFSETPETYWIEGWLALLNGNAKDAEDKLSRADEQRDDYQLTLMLTRALWNQEKYDQAFAVMRDWSEKHPEDVAIRMELAAGLLTRDRQEDAIAAYQQVLEIQPGHVVALNNLAFLVREVNLPEALRYAERAHELAPSDTKVMDTLGVLLMDSGDIDKALPLLEQAVEAAADNADFNLHLGKALLLNARGEEAAIVLNRVVSLAPGSKQATEAQELLSSI